MIKENNKEKDGGLMGKPDIAVKKWLSHKERFADFFNGSIFGGRQVILSNELTVMNSESNFIVSNKNDKGKSKGVQRYRDVVMLWRNSVTLMIMACEIQDKVHYAMPVKTMLYDGLSYANQMQELWNSLSEEERVHIKSEEFFSRFRKEDKLYPVITLVFYYGTSDWNGSVELYDMLHWDNSFDNDLLKQFIPNYRINLVQPAQIEDLTTYKTDLQMIFGMLKCRKDKKKMVAYINGNKTFFNAVDFETTQVIAEILHSKQIDNMLKKDRMEEYNMCKALDDLYNDGVAEGKAEGKAEDIVNLLSDYGKVSEDLKAKIYCVQDLEKLNSLLKLAARSGSIEEFEARM